MGYTEQVSYTAPSLPSPSSHQLLTSWGWGKKSAAFLGTVEVPAYPNCCGGYSQPYHDACGKRRTATPQTLQPAQPLESMTLKMALQILWALQILLSYVIFVSKNVLSVHFPPIQ